MSYILTLYFNMRPLVLVQADELFDLANKDQHKNLILESCFVTLATFCVTLL